MRIAAKVLMRLCVIGFILVRAEVVGATTTFSSAPFTGSPLEWSGYAEKTAELTLNGYDPSLYQIDDFSLGVTFDDFNPNEGVNIQGLHGSDWWPWLGQLTPVSGQSTLYLGAGEQGAGQDQLMHLNEDFEGGTLHLLFQGYGGAFTISDLSLTIYVSERPPDPVPEPPTIMLVAGGLLGLAGLRCCRGRWRRA